MFTLLENNASLKLEDTEYNENIVNMMQQNNEFLTMFKLMKETPTEEHMKLLLKTIEPYNFTLSLKNKIIFYIEKELKNELIRAHINPKKFIELK